MNRVYERDVNKSEFNRDFFVIEISGQGHCESKISL